jgi:hypothetical protein
MFVVFAILSCVSSEAQRGGRSAVADLRPGLAAIAAEDVDGLEDAALGDDVVALSGHIDLLQAERARRLARFASRRGHLAEGAASIVSWSRNRCRMSGSSAAEMVTTAQHLEALPDTSRALRHGEIGYQHASVIAHAARDLGDERVRDAQPILLEAARVLDVRRLREVAARLRECIDPDGSLGDANRMHEQRRLYMSRTLDGVFHIEGRLDPEAGAMVTTALNALSAPRPDDRRTAPQRRHDALVELCRRQLQGGGLPQVGGQRPQLWVMVPEATLRGEPGATGADLRWAGPVIGELARRLACDAARTEVTLDSAGDPVEVGRPTRTISAGLRRQLVARDRGCAFPGCDAPPEWCEGHHIIYVSRKGKTNRRNVALLCHFHHRLVHEGGWRIWWAPGPGWRLEAAPPRRVAAPP